MGATLSENAQRALIKARIKAGCIFHIFCDFITPPHNKFVIVVHIDYDEDLLLVFLVNSRIHPFIENNPTLKACQVSLKQITYPFLDHDSHADCSKVFDDIGIEEVVTHILNNRGDIKGDLSEDTVQEIIQAVAIATTITEDDKGLIINSLNK